uniref:AB hydrolase-1 domain-containing protein n=1 Tax=viral metagenome TaxID=1070528 RepID=A0A6C0LT04_9ZZZZ
MVYEAIDDTLIHYSYNKCNGNYNCVVMIHDIFASKESWFYLQQHFTKSNITNISIDIPGFGASPTLTTKYDYSYRSLAVIISLLLTKLAIGPCVVIGHGTGCIIAASLSTISANIKGIVMLSPNFDTPPSYLKVAPSCFVSSYVSRICKQYYQYNRLETLHEHQIIVKPFKHHFQNSYRRDVVERMIYAVESSYTDIIEMIFCPLFTIAPSKEKHAIHSNVLTTLADAGSTFKFVDHVGNFMHHEAPELIFTYICEFVKQLSKSDMSI